MKSNLIKSRGFWVGLTAVVMSAALVITIALVANPTKSQFDLNGGQQIGQNGSYTTYTSEDISSNSVVVGKKWTETVSGVSTLVATASEGYTFAYWNRTYSGTTLKFSGRDTIKVLNNANVTYTPVFVANSRIKMVSSLSDIANNYSSSNYDILMLSGDIDAAGSYLNSASQIFNNKVLDGAGYTIRNLQIKPTNNAKAGGLFSLLKNAIIKNLTIEGAYVYSGALSMASSLGTFVGGMYQNSVISNCLMKSSIVSTKENSQVGGLVGFADSTGLNSGTGSTDNCFIDGCTFAGSIMGYKVGAIICNNIQGTCTLIDNKTIGSMTALT